ncbi:MAG: MlaD family protein [Verrucomicrobium sp.]|nr:MlaD family protein [Verrucomicrobium sp.]
MQHDKGLEFKVGVFVLLALAVIAVLVIVFGRFGQGISKTYTIHVHFPNADGLLKGSDVQLAGAPIGIVNSAPSPAQDGQGVSVDLKIFKNLHIRSDARISIAEVGILGDRNVQIDPIPDSDAPYLKNGDRVEGQRAPGLSSLTDAAQPVLNELRSISAKLNNEVLTPETTTDLREAIKSMRSAMGRIDSLLAEAQSGKGTVGRLLRDPKTANDLSAFISNLRERGILFYSDVASERAKERR